MIFKLLFLFLNELIKVLLIVGLLIVGFDFDFDSVVFVVVELI